jgi:SAM-dependent methyltransferase
MTFEKFFWRRLLTKYPDLNFLDSGSFSPTATTQAVYSAAKDVTEPQMKILDLGCGSGVIGIGLLDQFNFNLDLYFSDIDSTSLDICTNNLKILNTVAEVRQSDIFEKWENIKFNLIVNDISGVPPIVSQFLDWFRGIPNASGYDGTELTEKVVKAARHFLEKDGTFLSLCDVEKGISALNKAFSEVKLVNTVKIPLNLEQSEIVNLQKLLPFATIKNVGSMHYFETYIYTCK